MLCSISLPRKHRALTPYFSAQISLDIARRAEEFAKVERERKKTEEKAIREAEKRQKEVKIKAKQMTEKKAKVSKAFQC